MFASRVLPMFILAASLLVAGCATLPEYREPPISTADVILNIKCELRDAAWSDPANSWVREWNAGLIISLLIDHNGFVDADASFVFPLNQGATFPLALFGGLNGSANRTERIDFKENLTDLRNKLDLPCSRDEPSHRARLGGKIGIEDLFARVTHAKDLAKINPKELNYNLDFVIRASASATPRFNMIPIGPEKTFTGSIKVGGSRTDTHTLKIVLQPPERVAGCPVPLSFGRCPTPVYNVDVPPPTAEAPKRRSLESGRSRATTTSQPVTRGITPLEEDRLNAARGRNVLESIEDQLRRQGLGN
jgi:hypothetical protein